MQYWLRRNNIEKGPFTKEALISQGLISNDLIRVDGDAEWKAVRNFPELQSALQGTSKPKYKFTADKKLIEIRDEVEHPAPPTVPTTGPKVETISGTSPFKRMPSALPKKKPTVAPAVDHTAENTAEKARERARLNTKLEKSVESSVTPSTASTQGQAIANTQAQLHASANTHTKIHTQVQSLDEAPLREVRHHPTPKPVRNASKPQNSHFFKEFFLPIIIIGGLGLLVWWSYKQFTTPSTGNPTLLASDTSLAAPAGNELDTQKSKIAKGEDLAAIPLKASTTKISASDSTQKAKKAVPIKDSIKAVKTPPAALATTSKPVVTKAAVQQQDSDLNDTPGTATAKAAPAKTTPVEKKTENPVAATPTIKKEPVKNTQKSAAIGDYINLSLNKDPEPGIKNVKIKIHNTSKDDLNIAVIEIKYFDKEGKFIQGETLQSGRINAGKTATLKIPSSKNATRISYKASLISGDQVYLMGR